MAILMRTSVDSSDEHFADDNRLGHNRVPCDRSDDPSVFLRKDEVRQMWQTIHRRYSSMRYEVPIIVAEDDKVAANIRVFFEKTDSRRVMQGRRGVVAEQVAQTRTNACARGAARSHAPYETAISIPGSTPKRRLE